MQSILILGISCLRVRKNDTGHDALYCLRKYASQKDLRRIALGTLESVHLCGIRACDLKPALESEWPDVEDCILARCAENVGADYLVTRDATGFARSKVSPITPEAAVALLAQRGLNYDEIAG